MNGFTLISFKIQHYSKIQLLTEQRACRCSVGGCIWKKGWFSKEIWRFFWDTRTGKFITPGTCTSGKVSYLLSKSIFLKKVTMLTNRIAASWRFFWWLTFFKKVLIFKGADMTLFLIYLVKLLINFSQEYFGFYWWCLYRK